MAEKENPFDKGMSESEIVEEAYSRVKNTKFKFSFTAIALVRNVHRDVAKRLHYEEPSQPSDFSKDVLPLLTLASAVIEEKSAELLIENLIEGKYQGEFAQREIENWSQGKREDALYQLDLIDTEFKEKLTAVRKTRNNLVHDPDKHHSFEEIEYGDYSLPEIIDMAVECAVELDKEALNSDLSYAE